MSDVPCREQDAAAAVPPAPRCAAARRFVSRRSVKCRSVGRLTERLDEHRQTFQPGLWSRLLGLAVIGVYLVLFVVLNSKTVKVRFVFASAKVSLIMDWSSSGSVNSARVENPRMSENRIVASTSCCSVAATPDASRSANWEGTNDRRVRADASRSTTAASQQISPN